MIRSRLIWISTVCKCMSVFTWCPISPTWLSLRSWAKPINALNAMKKYILIWTISTPDIFIQPKRLGMCIRSNILLAQWSTLLFLLFNMQRDLLKKRCFDFLPRPRGVKGQNICLPGVLCFNLINWNMQHDYCQRRRKWPLLPHQGVYKGQIIC